MCEPQTLSQAFNKKTLKKLTEFETRELEKQ